MTAQSCSVNHRWLGHTRICTQMYCYRHAHMPLRVCAVESVSAEMHGWFVTFCYTFSSLTLKVCEPHSYHPLT
jgi:hypothetical protein